MARAAQLAKTHKLQASWERRAGRAAAARPTPWDDVGGGSGRSARYLTDSQGPECMTPRAQRERERLRERENLLQNFTNSVSGWDSYPLRLVPVTGYRHSTLLGTVG